PELRAATPSRVVVVAAAGFNGDIHFDDPTLASRFRTFRALTQSQQANDVFTVEMARRLEGTGVTINVLNPGLVDTRIRREMHWLLHFLMERVFGRFWMMTPAEGARMPLRLALDPEFAGVSG